MQQAKEKWKISSAGPDGIPVQLVKNVDNNMLAALFSTTNHLKFPPTSFNEARTILIHEKGERKDLGNNRPITIGSAIKRLYHRILAHRLNNAVTTTSQQRGFKCTDGTLANTLILNAYICRRRNKGQSYNILTLELSKAFDTAFHSAIRSALIENKLSPQSVNLLMRTLDRATTTVHSGGKTSGAIRNKRGVRQGDPFSSTLFNLAIDGIISELNSNINLGGTIDNNNIKICGLAVADDIVVLEDKSENICIILSKIEKFFAGKGLQLNPEKCSIIADARVNGVSVPRRTTAHKINEIQIPVVSDLNTFAYLGHEIAATSYLMPSIANIATCSNNIRRAPLKTFQKLELIKAHMIPKLTYSLQNPKIEGTLFGLNNDLFFVMK